MAMVKYISNHGRNLENPLVSVVLTFTPGIGRDVMLVEEFVFASIRTLTA